MSLEIKTQQFVLHTARPN